MKNQNSYTYNNIDCKFTFENICSLTTKFWLKNVINRRHKIWLTIVVVNSNERNIKLIDRLPFNTSDFSDVIVVLRQIFESKILLDRKDTLNRIIFNCYFDNEKRILKSKGFIFYSFITITLLSLLLFIFILLFLNDILELIYYDSLYNMETINETINVSECADNISKKNSIFNPIISLFNAPYFKSCFHPNEIRVECDSFNLLEYIIYNQYNILDNHVYITREYINELNNILMRYQSITNSIL
jgi:hypothetical protein